MIIYGTGNFNRRNQSIVRCGCSNCGRRDYQRSYTSTRFFTLYFIPVIPLGSQKVLQECQHCKNAHGLSLRDHKRQTKDDLPKAISAFENDSTDPENAKELIEAIVRTQSVTSLEAYAPQIAHNFPRNGEILCTLAEACSYLCLDSLADPIFLQSITADDNAEIAASAARHLKLKGKAKPKQPNRALQSLPILIIPGFLLFIFGNLLSKVLSDRPEHIYLVNGLDQAYEVYVNDELVRLDPNERIDAHMLHYDLNTIRPVVGSLPIEPKTFTIEGNAFDDTVYIVNPDRAAIISWEALNYSSELEPVDRSRFKILTGKAVYAQQNIDYAFIDFPESLVATTTTEDIFRTRLGLLQYDPASDIIPSFVESNLDVELEAYLTQFLKFEKEDYNLINAGLRFLSPEKLQPLLAQHTKARPIEVEWHRAHQDTQVLSNRKTLQQHYQTLYNADRSNNQLAYLYARICDDPEQAKQIMLDAANSSQPSGYACYGLSNHYMLEGDFDSALTYAEQANAWLPSRRIFDHTRLTSLYALHKYEIIKKEAETQLDHGIDFVALDNLAYASAKLGKANEAIERIEFEVRAWKVDYQIPETEAVATLNYYDEIIALANSNKSEFLQALKRGTDTYHTFESHIVEGRLYDAIYLATTSPDSIDTNDLLLLSILAKQAGHDDLSKKQLDKAISHLETSDREAEKQWAKWLSGAPLPQRSKIIHTCRNIDQQLLLILALGKSQSNLPFDYLQHAQKLIFQETFYTFALKDAKVI